jgi:hypothetical protein
VLIKVKWERNHFLSLSPVREKEAFWILKQNLFLENPWILWGQPLLPAHQRTVYRCL